MGDGQTDQVYNIEVATIKVCTKEEDGSIGYVLPLKRVYFLLQEALAPLYQAASVPLRLGFVIVSKRINTRIFLQEKNPPPGTIVDSCITSPFK